MWQPNRSARMRRLRQYIPLTLVLVITGAVSIAAAIATLLLTGALGASGSMLGLTNDDGSSYAAPTDLSKSDYPRFVDTRAAKDTAAAAQPTENAWHARNLLMAISAQRERHK